MLSTLLSRSLQVVCNLFKNYSRLRSSQLNVTRGSVFVMYAPSLRFVIALGYVHTTIPDTVYTATQIIVDRAQFCSHTNRCSGAISLTERKLRRPRRFPRWRVTYRIGVHIMPESFSWLNIKPIQYSVNIPIFIAPFLSLFKLQ